MFLPFLKLQHKNDFLLLSHLSAWNFVVDKSKYIHKISSLFCDLSGTRSMFNGLQRLSMLSLVEVCKNAPIHTSTLCLKRKKKDYLLCRTEKRPEILICFGMLRMVTHYDLLSSNLPIGYPLFTLILFLLFIVFTI